MDKFNENINLFAKQKDQSTTNDTKKEKGPSSPSDKSTGPKTTFKDWWKWLKWILILGLIALFIWLIWYVSTPHYRSIKLKSITWSDDNITLVSNTDVTYTGKDSSFKAQYYIDGGNHSVMKFYLNTNSGQIEFNGERIISTKEITVGEESSIPVVEFNWLFSECNLTYAIADGSQYYSYIDGAWAKVSTEAGEHPEIYGLISSFQTAYTSATVPSSSNIGYILLNLLPTIIIVALFIWYFAKISKLQGGSGEESLWSVGKSQAKLARSNVKFENVAGLAEEKTELIEIVDYLKNPNKYSAMGARAPKGVILYGPPGTGKTLLAKAVAGEAKVPFYQVTGSSFEDMLVGVGAKRVRDLFTNAKKSAPSIIFIDEFDSVAAKRGRNEIAGASAGIADQTINQLLAEMDGFDTKSGIVIIAATNRLDVLDEAILRPGRFDRHIQVNLPDIKEREAILKIHAQNKNISSRVDLADIARRTPGFSGAQLENVLNEATLLAVRANKTSVSMEEIDEGIDRVIAGPAKKTRVITEAEKRQIAFHEAGHALVGLNLPGSDVVEKITIIPRGQAAGYTLSTPEKQEISIQKKSDLLSIVCSTLAGRAAEEIEYGKENISTGAANDLYKVSNIVRAMVAQLGMTDLGMTQLIPTEGQVNPYSKSYSEATAQKVDAKVEQIISEQYKRALDIIKKNYKELELIVTSLLVLETIVKKQIDYIHKNKKLPEEVIERQKLIEARKVEKKSEAKKKVEDKKDEENKPSEESKN